MIPSLFWSWTWFKIKRPFLLPQRVYDNDINKLKETIKNHRTHKSSTRRGLLLVETAMNTGLRRAEHANLAAGHINFEARRLLVLGSKGNKVRVIPLTASLAFSLHKCCEEFEPNQKIFGLSYRSLGLILVIGQRRQAYHYTSIASDITLLPS